MLSSYGKNTNNIESFPCQNIWDNLLKGRLVHSNINIVSSFAHTNVVWNCLFWNTKGGKRFRTDSFSHHSLLFHLYSIQTKWMKTLCLFVFHWKSWGGINVDIRVILGKTISFKLCFETFFCLFWHIFPQVKSFWTSICLIFHPNVDGGTARLNRSVLGSAPDPRELSTGVLLKAQLSLQHNNSDLISPVKLQTVWIRRMNAFESGRMA